MTKLRPDINIEEIFKSVRLENALTVHETITYISCNTLISTIGTLITSSKSPTLQSWAFLELCGNKKDGEFITVLQIICAYVFQAGRSYGNAEIVRETTDALDS